MRTFNEWMEFSCARQAFGSFINIVMRFYLMKAVSKSANLPKISIIILNHNGLAQNKEMLVQCVMDALSVKLNKEIIFVDNGSTDGSVEFVKQNFPREILYVCLKQNMGYSQGMNEGAKHASQNSKYLFFVNNDVSFSEKVVEHMVKTLEGHEDVAILGAGIWHRDRVFVGSFFDLRLTHHTPKGLRPPYCVTAVENFIAVRSSVFNILGGFEPNIFQVYDEADLCLRAWLAGYKVMCDPRLIVYHRHKLPIKRNNPIRVFRFMRNKYLIMIKYYEPIYLIVYLPLKILTDIWWSVTNPRWGRRRSIIMVFRSIFDLVSNLRTYYERRIKSQKLKRKKIKDLIKIGVLKL